MTLLTDLQEAKGIAWVGPHPDDEIWASDILALAALSGKRVYVVSLKNDPTLFPPGGTIEDRFADNEEVRQFLGLQEYFRWNLNEQPEGYEIRKELTRQFIKNYFLQNNIDLCITWEPTHGGTAHPEHIAVSQWLTEFAQGTNVKVYHMLVLDPLLARFSQDQKVDSQPFTDEINLDSYYVDTWLGNMSLWEVKLHVIRIYENSVDFAYRFFGIPGLAESVSHLTFYKLAGAEVKPCLVATVAFGTPMAKELYTLRKFRDTFMLRTFVGALLVKTYYAVSVPLAKIVQKKSKMKFLLRRVIQLIVK